MIKTLLIMWLEIYRAEEYPELMDKKVSSMQLGLLLRHNLSTNLPSRRSYCLDDSPAK